MDGQSALLLGGLLTAASVMLGTVDLFFFASNADSLAVRRRADLFSGPIAWLLAAPLALLLLGAVQLRAG